MTDTDYTALVEHSRVEMVYREGDLDSDVIELIHKLADAIEALQAEVAELKHDIERHLAIVAEETERANQQMMAKAEAQADTAVMRGALEKIRDTEVWETAMPARTVARQALSTDAGKADET
jgi:cell division septum initiation protein DivIVA